MFYRELFPEPEKAGNNGQAYEAETARRTDEEVEQLARAATNRAKFVALFDDGELTDHNNNWSQADFSLVCRIAFYAGRVPAQIDRVFRKSALMRDKWDEPRSDTTYGGYTIAKALARFGPDDFYVPPIPVALGGRKKAAEGEKPKGEGPSEDAGDEGGRGRS